MADEVAIEIFKQLTAFAGYGFCKSHAAAFAVVAYQTLYLKAHYPAALTCALLNHQPMGFYAPDVLIGDARRHDLTIRRPDVNQSREACTLVKAGTSPAVRLGLRYVRGLGETWQKRIVARRGDRPFRDLRDVCRRTRLPKSLIENLIRAGAMDGFGRARRDLLWDLGGLSYREDELGLETLVEAVDLPVLSRVEHMLWEYELLGLTPDGHVVSLYRDALRARGVSSSEDLRAVRHGQVVRAAGLVVTRQRPPSAKGHVFITLEDEDGLVNLIVRPKVYERYRDALRGAPFLLVEGQLQRADEAVSVLVHYGVRLGR